MITETATFTVVVDDRAGRAGLRAAHGFACWIERDGINILFDTGPDGKILATNLRTLGLEIAFLDAVVVSHGHRDHGGGLGWLLSRRPDLPVYLHPAALDGHFSKGKDAGFPNRTRGVLRLSDVHFVDGWHEIVPGFSLTGPVPHRTEFETVPPTFTLDRSGRIPDPLTDDISLVVATPRGDVVVTGCAHAGLVNILDFVRERLGERPLHGFVGGTHLHDAERDRLKATAERLENMALGCMAPCHCSGDAIGFLQETFPAAFHPVAVGTRLEVGDG